MWDQPRRHPGLPLDDPLQRRARLMHRKLLLRKRLADLEARDRVNRIRTKIGV
jgi:hypothetical protein